jgi:hypothetical protein
MQPAKPRRDRRQIDIIRQSPQTLGLPFAAFHSSPHARSRLYFDLSHLAWFTAPLFEG